MDMGLGKTVVTLTAIQELMYDYFDIIKVLVIAPLRVAEDTWSSETEKWGNLKYLKISKVLGSEKECIAALNTTADIYVINRENVVWLVKYYGRDWPFDMVVIDELSSFKSSKSQRFKALRKVKPKRIVGLTETPAPNGLMDLWSEIYLLDGGARLGKTITGYRERYFNPDKRNQKWSLELYQQANARLYRQGQKENVIVHHLVAKGTMDEDVMKALQNKEVGQEALLKAVKAVKARIRGVTI